VVGPAADPEHQAQLVIPAVCDTEQLHPDPLTDRRGAFVIGIGHGPHFRQPISKPALQNGAGASLAKPLPQLSG
jgi:hypothetical protein